MTFFFVFFAGFLVLRKRPCGPPSPLSYFPLLFSPLFNSQLSVSPRVVCVRMCCVLLVLWSFLFILLSSSSSSFVPYCHLTTCGILEKYTFVRSLKIIIKKNVVRIEENLNWTELRKKLFSSCSFCRIQARFVGFFLSWVWLVSHLCCGGWKYRIFEEEKQLPRDLTNQPNDNTTDERKQRFSQPLSAYPSCVWIMFDERIYWLPTKTLFLTKFFFSSARSLDKTRLERKNSIRSR